MEHGVTQCSDGYKVQGYVIPPNITTGGAEEYRDYLSSFLDEEDT